MRLLTPVAERLLFCILSLAIRTAATAATLKVSTTADSGPGSLRAAVRDAVDGDTIKIAVTGAIVLTDGELLVEKGVNIAGPGARQLTITGLNHHRLFNVTGNGVTISGSHPGRRLQWRSRRRHS